MQLSLLKDQIVESQKFVNIANLMIMANILPHSSKGSSYELQESINDILSTIRHRIEYNDEAAENYYSQKEQKQKDLIDMVNHLPSNSVTFKMVPDLTATIQDRY